MVMHIPFGEMFWPMLAAMGVFGALKLVGASLLYALSQAKVQREALEAPERSLHAVEEN